MLMIKQTDRDKDLLINLQQLVNWEKVSYCIARRNVFHANVTLDEQLFSSQYRCPFTQQMPQKPASWHS